MSEWRTRIYTLTDLGKVSRGRSRHRPRDDKSLYGGKYPFIQTGDVKNANFYLKSYTQTYNDKGLAQSKLWKAGTLCITIAANIAETAILSIDACFPDSIVGFTPFEGISDVRYVKYYFDIYKKQMQAMSLGATQDNFSVDKMLKVKFVFPDYPAQSRIASILSSGRVRKKLRYDIIAIKKVIYMATVEVKCPACGSTRVYKYGRSKTGTQRYMCHSAECKRKTFRLEYRYEGAKPGIDEKIIVMAANASGIRDTARVPGISTDKVMDTLKKLKIQ